MPERVQLSRAAGWRMPPNTVKVTRPGPWGNPFVVWIYYHAAKLQKAVKHHDVPSIREYAADVANMAMMLRQRFYKRHLPPIPTDSHQILTRNRQESQITGRRNGVADGARTQTARTPTIPLTTPFIGAQRFSVP